MQPMIKFKFKADELLATPKPPFIPYEIKHYEPFDRTVGDKLPSTEQPEAQACLNKLCRLIVEECIYAVRDADETHAHTTFDRDMIRGTKQRCVTSIKERLSL